MARKAKVRIEQPPHVVRPGMDPNSLARAIQQNLDHISGQLQALARALAELQGEPEDAPPLEVPSVTVRFKRYKRRHRVQYNCIARFPAVEGDDDTVVRYVGQLIYTDSLGNPVELDDDGKPIVHRARMDVPDEGDARDTYKLVWWNLLKPKKWYVSVRVRPVGRQGPVGDWTPWTAPLLPFDNVSRTAPARVRNVQARNPSPRRVVFTWDEPDPADDEATVDHYLVEVYRKDGAVFTLVETGKTRHERYVYRVPKADRGKVHKAKVFVVDEDDERDTIGVESLEQADTETWDGSADLAPGSIADLTPFASSIRPVALVSSLPSLPNPDYPPGSYVYHTGARLLYENQNNVWVQAVRADNMSGQLDGATQIAPNSITADRIVANSITGGEIAAGAISTTHLAAGAVTADKMSVSQLSAISANAGTLTAGVIEGLVIRTAGSGNRITMKDGDPADRLVFKSDAGNPALVAGGGQISLVGGDLDFGGSDLQPNGGLHLANAGGDLPAPGAGVVLYAKGGRLYYRSADGTVYGPL